MCLLKDSPLFLGGFSVLLLVVPSAGSAADSSSKVSNVQVHQAYSAGSAAHSSSKFCLWFAIYCRCFLVSLLLPLANAQVYLLLAVERLGC
ncbi:hypothetical protein U1Q18_021064 [Sarracenia purpurea var. burkii]